MGRRIFEEKGYCLNGKVLPYGEVRLFEGERYEVDPDISEKLIERAEKALATEIPQLYATEYMMFRRNGNRSVFQDAYFARREIMLSLAIGEYLEGRGRFTDKLIDTVWLVLEETSWVLPAHNPQLDGVKCPLPYAYADECDYIDLFSASTGADLAVVYYLCGDALKEVSTLITDRILYELDRRIIKPYLNDEHIWRRCIWTGVNGKRVNNWCPWIISNILTVVAMAVKDDVTRTVTVRRSLPLLDNFTQLYHPDGGCDEGPSYWGAAGGALVDALMLLDRLTGGYVNLFDDPLVKNMGEYIVKVTVGRDRALNFADSPAKISPSGAQVYHWGKAVGSEMMRNYAAWRLDGEPVSAFIGLNHTPYRALLSFTTPRLPRESLNAPMRFYIGGIAVAGTREYAELDRGLYLALKGGHNGESHNHNDLGNLIVFADGKPIFIDAGSGTYTKRTFGEDRYSIWAMCSDYHNTATFSGVTQKNGSEYRACNEVYDQKTGRLALDLTNAYPAESGLRSYTRSAVLQGGVITVVDEVEFAASGSVSFSFITVKKPESVSPSSFVLQGRTVSFDPTLKYSIEALDATEPEVNIIPERWDTDTLYRIRLTSPDGIVSQKFVLTVK